MLTLDLALAGLGVGAIAALAGLGLIVTHRLTGVLNLAFGAIAMLAAYVLWQAVNVWHLPVIPTAIVDVGVLCPALGLALERVVFRSLERRAASPAERLVASVGVLVVALGAATVVWGSQTRLDVPSLVPYRRFVLPGDVRLPLSTLVDIAAVLAVSAAAAFALRTSMGRRLRAVVADRRLAELQGIDVDRVSAIGWAAGSGIAGLTGVLLAPTVRLQPYAFTLVVLETLVVIVVARLVDPWRAVVTGLLLGVVQAELTRFHVTGRWRTLWDAATSNLFVVALLVAVVMVGRLDEPVSGDTGTVARMAVRGRLRPLTGWWVPLVLALVAPLLFAAEDLRTALAVPAMAIVLVSIVVVSGYGGQVSLGQAGFAGLGALVTARLADGTMPGLPRITDISGLFVGAAIVAPLGLLLGWPAIRRRGLFLALTTFALGVVASRFVFEQPAMTSGVHPRPPGAFASDHNFYVLELGILAAALIVVRNLRSGRLGRALVAMRDDEQGARASGIDTGRLKLFVFVAGAAIAALGGGLLAMGARAFDASAFDPVRGLLWFAAVVVMGIDSAAGAVVGAGVLITLDSALPEGSATLVVGVLAVLVGWMPGGLLHTLRRGAQLLGDRRRASTPRGRPTLGATGRLLLARVAARGVAR